MFGLVTAINVEDVPLIMRNAAKNFRGNAKNDDKIVLERRKLRQHYPELWECAAQLLEQCANTLESQIKEVKAREPVIRTTVKRAVL